MRSGEPAQGRRARVILLKDCASKHRSIAKGDNEVSETDRGVKANKQFVRDNAGAGER